MLHTQQITDGSQTTSSVTNIAQHRRWLGERAFSRILYLVRTPLTHYGISTLEDTLRPWVRKGHTVSETIRHARAVADTILKNRISRQNRRYRGNVPIAVINATRLFPHNTGNSRWSMPILHRLAAHKLNLDKAAKRRAIHALWCYMPCLSGNSGWDVEWVDTFEAVGARTATSKGDRYSSRCTYRKTDGTLYAKLLRGHTVPLEIELLHDMVTLVALPVDTGRDGEQAWHAKWARRSTGWTVKVEEGFIVCRDGQYTHGSTLGVARSTLTRRATEAKLDRMEADLLRRVEEHRLNGMGDTIVRISDSTCAGNCLSGTLAFRDRYLPGRDTATANELVSLADTVPVRRYVIAAVLHALRREHRDTLLAATA